MSRFLLVGLCGFAGTGKDTAAKYLSQTYGYDHRAFADKLRDLAWDLNPSMDGGSSYRRTYDEYGYEVAKAEVPEFRDFLKALGNGARTHIHEDVWVDAALKGVRRKTVFSDVRFLNEARHMDAVIRIIRPGYGPESDFEREVELIQADDTVVNDGTVSEFYNDLAKAMAEL